MVEHRTFNAVVVGSTPAQFNMEQIEITFDQLKDFISTSILDIILMEEIDKKMIPWVMKFNKLKNVITMESCEGHSEDDKPYICLLLNEKIYNLGEDIYQENDVWSRIGELKKANFYMFCFELDTWQEEIEKLYNKLK